MAIVDLLQYTQSILSALIFSFFLAKLFSLIFAFDDENPNELKPNVNKTSQLEEDKRLDEEITNKLVIDQPNKVVEAGIDNSDDDDWEGVETSELYQEFSAATAFMASKKVSTNLKLEMYGLYKIATQGACTVPKPSAVKITARAKWKAWYKLGAMSPEEAMHKYIDIITKLYPTLTSGSTYKRANGDSNEPSSKDIPTEPVLGSFIHEEESGKHIKLEAIHDFAREGDTANLLKCVEGGASVDTNDSEGQTPLHSAVDQGNIDVTELLMTRNTDDNAAVRESEAIAELLVKKNAGKDIKDDDGNFASDLCDSSWPLIQPELADNL